MDLWLPPHDFRARSLRKLAYGFAASPFGEFLAAATDSHLAELRFSDDRDEAISELKLEWPATDLLPSREIESLIDGVFRHPEKIPVMAIGTPFQLTTWEFLRAIPPTSTLTYGEVAHAIGRPLAARAVGQAVGANGIAVVIPCHRVVSRAKLTGYRWGLERKKQLLAWELAGRKPLEVNF